MRFRRRVKLFPGVTLNFSKTGISTTVGVPGASLNFNKHGTFLNTSLSVYSIIRVKETCDFRSKRTGAVKKRNL